MTCHDGFTLNDLVSYNSKHNEANGEGNRDGATTISAGTAESKGRPTIRDRTAAQSPNQELPDPDLAVVGTPMLLMGDEVRRTQRGNNNAYCQDNEISWFDWSGRQARGHSPLCPRIIALRMNRNLPVELLDMTLNELLHRQPVHGTASN